MHHRDMFCIPLLLLFSLLAGCATAPESPPAPERLAALVDTTAVRRLLREGKPDLALLRLEPLLARHPNDATLHDLAGQALTASGEHARALEHFERALALRPDDPELRVNRAVVLCRLGRGEAAEPAFVEAATMPGMRHAAVALVNAGLCARRGGRVERAARYFRAALQADSRSAAALYQLARLALEQGRPMQARTYLIRYQAVGPETPKSLLLQYLVGEASGDGQMRQAAEAELFGQFGDTPAAMALREGRAAEWLGLRTVDGDGPRRPAYPSGEGSRGGR